MDGPTKVVKDGSPVWFDANAGHLDAFRTEVERKTQGDDYPYAVEISDNVPVYSGADVRQVAVNPQKILALTAEFNTAFETGPGIIVIRDGVPDHAVIDAATCVFEKIIEEERDQGSGGGDHFAKPGANDRIWNAAEKHCRADPANFAAYYASDCIALAAQACIILAS